MGHPAQSTNNQSSASSPNCPEMNRFSASVIPPNLVEAQFEVLIMLKNKERCRSVMKMG